MLVRSEGIQPDPDKAAACFFHFMTTGMPPAEAPGFVDEAAAAWNRVREAAEVGDDSIREWRSNLYTAVPGQLLTGIQDVPNLRATNWKELLNGLCTRLLNDFGDAYARGDPQVRRGRFAGVPEPRRPAAGGRIRADLVLHVVLYRRLSGRLPA